MHLFEEHRGWHFVAQLMDVGTAHRQIRPIVDQHCRHGHIRVTAGIGQPTRAIPDLRQRFRAEKHPALPASEDDCCVLHHC